MSSFCCKTISHTPFHRSGCDTYLIAGSCWSVIVNLSNSANAVYIISQLKYNLLQQNLFPELRCALVDSQDSHKSRAMRESVLQGSRVFNPVDLRLNRKMILLIPLLCNEMTKLIVFPTLSFDSRYNWKCHVDMNQNHKRVETSLCRHDVWL